MRYLRILCICIIQLFLSAVAFAQTQVTGHVADVRGEDIIGANVTVKGTSNGTITDIDGNFTINVDDKNGTLAVSFIGYKTKEVKIGEKARLQIVLEEDTDPITSRMKFSITISASRWKMARSWLGVILPRPAP